jgi:hypothetical protein
LAGQDYARKIALLAEYPANAPQVSGPELGRPSEAEALGAMFGPMLTKACDAADWAAAHFPAGANTTEVGGRPSRPTRERSG